MVFIFSTVQLMLYPLRFPYCISQIMLSSLDLKNGKKNHEWKTLHGFRKFFKTQGERVMKSLNVEILIGHDIGLANSYYKPSEHELLEDYIKAELLEY